MKFTLFKDKILSAGKKVKDQGTQNEGFFKRTFNKIKTKANSFFNKVKENSLVKNHKTLVSIIAVASLLSIGYVGGKVNLLEKTIEGTKYVSNIIWQGFVSIFGWLPELGNIIASAYMKYFSFSYAFTVITIAWLLYVFYKKLSTPNDNDRKIVKSVKNIVMKPVNYFKKSWQKLNNEEHHVLYKNGPKFFKFVALGLVLSLVLSVAANIGGKIPQVQPQNNTESAQSVDDKISENAPKGTIETEEQKPEETVEAAPQEQQQPVQQKSESQVSYNNDCNSNSNDNTVSQSTNEPQNNSTPEGSTEQQDETITTDDSQANFEEIKDDVVEDVQPEPENEDVEIIEPELEPEQEETPQVDEPQTEEPQVEAPEAPAPQEDEIFKPGNTDYIPAAVTLSGNGNVKVNEIFTVTATATDDTEVKSFNITTSSIVGLSHVKLVGIEMNGNTATITLQALEVGTDHISIIPEAAVDAAGNTSGKSNEFTILVTEDTVEEPQVDDNQNETEQPQVDENQPEQPQVEDNQNSEAPELDNQQPEEPQVENNQPENEQPQIENQEPEQPQTEIQPNEPNDENVQPEQPQEDNNVEQNDTNNSQQDNNAEQNNSENVQPEIPGENDNVSDEEIEF